MSRTILELKNIKKAFPGVLALDGINFDLKAGEVHAICGENGAGKSTLMKVVSGVYKPDGGEIFVNGKQEDFHNPMEAYEKGVSIIFQETSLFEEMTVMENLFLGHELQRKAFGFLNILDYPSMRQRVEQILKRLDTSIAMDEQVKNLGMAEKQMVEIAKGLTFDAKILIFDEPTASLTQREVDALFQIIDMLKKEEIGIVYISHRLEEIFQIADRVTVIRDGAYISTENTGDTNKDELVSHMVGRSMDNYYPKTATSLGDIVFEVEGISDGELLNNVSFYVKQGEILGFAGLAGAGRTEVMETISGLAKKESGKIVLNKKELNIRDYKDAMNQGIVYVSEDRGKYGLITDMRIDHNISLPQLKHFSVKNIMNETLERDTAEKYMKDISIKAPGSDFMVENLSGGNQQKVAIAKALALHPKILILDEPTRGVDVNAKAEIHKIISALTREGLTIIMVSSELPELLGMCDRIYVMKEGYIAGSFDREEASQNKILKVALEG